MGELCVKNKAMDAKGYLSISVAAILLIQQHSLAQSLSNRFHQKKVIMSVSEKNKAIVRTIYEEVLNQRNLGLLDEIVSPDYVGPTGKKGPLAFAEPVSQLIQAFPDIVWTIDELIGEDEKIVVTWQWTGTQNGKFQYIDSSGLSITNAGMAIYQFENGKVTGSKVYTDRLGFLQQLQLLPSDITLIQRGNKGQIAFIDRFVVPKNSMKEFAERVTINRNYIKSLSGFVRDETYVSENAGRNALIVITVALWENAMALQKARDAVQEFYRQEGFDPGRFMEKLNVEMERTVSKVGEL